MSSEDDDRIAYLAGDDDSSLPEHERKSLDELRAFLAIPAIWAEPEPSVEDAIFAAIEQEARARAEAAPVRRPVGRKWPASRPALALAGAAAAALGASEVPATTIADCCGAGPPLRVPTTIAITTSSLRSTCSAK